MEAALIFLSLSFEGGVSISNSLIRYELACHDADEASLSFPPYLEEGF